MRAVERAVERFGERAGDVQGESFVLGGDAYCVLQLINELEHL